MTENTYRLLLGTALILAIYTESKILAYSLVIMTLIEGITNYRVNIVVSKLLLKVYGRAIPHEPESSKYRYNVAAERVQRIFIGVSFFLIFFIAPQDFWYLNWLFAIAMILSGIVMFCPVVALFRYLGFR